MSSGLDTSVVVRVLTGQSAEQAETARAFIEHSPTPVFVSDLVISEAYFVLTHHYAAPHTEAVKALGAFLSDSRVQSSGVAKVALAASLNSSENRSAPGLMDRLIHADYARDDIKVATFDRELSRMPGAQLLK